MTKDQKTQTDEQEIEAREAAIRSFGNSKGFKRLDPLYDQMIERNKYYQAQYDQMIERNRLYPKYPKQRTEDTKP